MSDVKSCFVEKLEHFMPLSEGDAELLAQLEKEQVAFKQGEARYRGGDPAESLYVVRKGWLFSYSMLADGRRQVLRLHYPGDLVGVDNLPFRKVTHDLEAVTDGVLCPLPKKCLDDILMQSPKLSALLWTLSIVEQTTFLDRIRVLGRMNSEERVAHLVLEVESRLRVTGGTATDGSFRLPLRQQLIGDMLGLTNVTVSRTMSKLKEQGLISLDGRAEPRVRVLSREKLVELATFHDRFADLDMSWFPEADRG